MDKSFINRTLAKYDRDYSDYVLGGFYARLSFEKGEYKGPLFIYQTINRAHRIILLTQDGPKNLTDSNFQDEIDPSTLKYKIQEYKGKEGGWLIDVQLKHTLARMWVFTKESAFSIKQLFDSEVHDRSSDIQSVWSQNSRIEQQWEQPSPVEPHYTPSRQPEHYAPLVPQ